jgi:Glycosyltransferase Family 4
MPKKILIISKAPMRLQPRAVRQIRCLENYDILLCSEDNEGFEHLPFISLTSHRKTMLQKCTLAFLLLFRRYEAAYWYSDMYRNAYDELLKQDFEVIIAHDYYTLPLAVRLAKNKGTKVLYDAHEYAPRQYEHDLKFQLVFKGYATYICKKYIPQVDAMVTVSQKIAEEYEKDTGIRSRVLTSAPAYEKLEPKLLRKDTRKISLVHHGLAGRTRGIAEFIKMLDVLDERFEVHLYLVSSDTGYLDELKIIAKNYTSVYFHNPVPTEKLPAELNQYDLGLIIAKPINFNLANALPNKFFEYIQARLGIALIGPFPDMAKIVNKNGLGVIGNNYDYEALARQLNTLTTEQINGFKRQAQAVAYEFSANKNCELLKSIVDEISTT